MKKLLLVLLFSYLNLHALVTSSPAVCSNGATPTLISDTQIADQYQYIRYGSEPATETEFTYSFDNKTITTHFLDTYNCGSDDVSTPITYSSDYTIEVVGTDTVKEQISVLQNPITYGHCAYGGYQNYFHIHKLTYECEIQEQTCDNGLSVGADGECQSCEDVGLISQTLVIGGPTTCVSIASQESRLNNCISSCGGDNNIKFFDYDTSSGYATCQCADTSDMQINPNDYTTEISSATDVSESDSLLLTMTNEMIDNQATINDSISNLNSTTEQSLNKLDSLNDSISNMDGNITDSLNDLKSTLEDSGEKTDEANGFLEDILGLVDNISANISSYLDELVESYDNITSLSNSVDSTLSNADTTDSEAQTEVEGYITDLETSYDTLVTTLDSIHSLGDTGFTYSPGSGSISTCGTEVYGVNILGTFFDLLSPLSVFISLFVQIYLIWTSIKIFMFTINMFAGASL